MLFVGARHGAEGYFCGNWTILTVFWRKNQISSNGISSSSSTGFVTQKGTAIKIFELFTAVDGR